MAKLVYTLKGKNGQLYCYEDGSLVVGRAGWFGFLYQLLAPGALEFAPGQVHAVKIRELNWMRGYIRLEGEADRAIIWLTRPDMVDQARAVEQWLRDRKAALERKQRRLLGDI